MAATPGTAEDNNDQNGVPGINEDPYIWLEDARSPEALRWVNTENERTLSIMEQDPRFEELQRAALTIYDSEDRVPFVSFRPDGLYNFWQDRNNPKGILRRTSLDSYRTEDPVWETILNIDEIAKAEGRDWVFKGSTCLPPLLNKCMIALSDGGEDATIMREFDTAKKEFVKNGFVLDQKSQGGVSWIDENTLLVNRNFNESTTTESEYPFTSRIWLRGTRIEDAVEIFRGDHSDVWAGAGLLRDSTGTIHARTAFRGISFHETIYYVEKEGKWIELEMPRKASISGIVDGHVLLSTDTDWHVDDKFFPADSLIAMNLEEWKNNPNNAEKNLVWSPGNLQTKKGGAITANSFFVEILDNVSGKVLEFNFDEGRWVTNEIDLPQNATVDIAAASSVTNQIMFTVTDFLNPTMLYYSNGGPPRLLKQSPGRFNQDGMMVEQHTATSKDGTTIPYFVVRPDVPLGNGTMPTLLTGYGGFQIPRLPSYLGVTGKLWLENGGAYVLANLRGGGEFGPNWHQTAIRENKQRTWDDFIAVAQDLIDKGFTSPKKLGIMGGSQGGLLVGTAFTQRPDLFNAAIVQIPLFDMLRYHLIGRGASWVGEYGDPRIPNEREWIEDYSPYQKIVEGVDYPTPFLWASTADDRTHPAHARKGAARLKEIGQPYFYFEDVTGGHSGGVDNEQRAKLQALQYLYLMRQLMDD